MSYSGASYTTVSSPALEGLRAIGMITSPEIIKTNQVLLAGTVLGKITATGLLIPCVETVSDGSEVPHSILVHDVNTSATGSNAQDTVGVMVAGQIDFTSLIVDGSWSYATLKEAFRPNNIYIFNSQLDSGV